jgi:hypothetical protein
MDVLYTTLASQLELPNEHDDTPCQIIWQNDYIEVDALTEDNSVIMVTGYSHISGDSVFYLIPATAEVEVWAV